MILTERAARIEAEAVASRAAVEALNAKAAASSTEALIAHLTLQIEKLRRELYGSRSERKARLLDQLEMQLEDAEATAGEDASAAEATMPKTDPVTSVSRRRSGRKPFPAHLLRERVVVPAPHTCACCGSDRLRKLGEDVTETLEMIPRQWKVIQTVREKFSCRDCERISQAPAPFHPTPRGFLGPNLLATILFEKYGQHQPLNRQSERYGREGVDLPLSTLADQVGACVHALRPLHDLIEAHVFKAERLHGDDTTVPILAKGKTVTGRIWTYLWTVPALQGSSHHAGKSSVQLSIRPYGIATTGLDEIRGSAPNYVGEHEARYVQRALPTPVRPVAIILSNALADEPRSGVKPEPGIPHRSS